MKKMFLTALLALSLLAAPALAGVSSYSWQAGQIESDGSTTCTPYSALNANGMPMTVQQCSLAQYSGGLHFRVPSDFISAGSGGVTWMSDTDATTLADSACWQAAVTVWINGPTSGSYTGLGLAALSATSAGVVSPAVGNPVGSQINTLPWKKAVDGSACDSSCANGQAYLSLHRVPCSGGTALTGNANLINGLLNYTTP